MKLNIGQFEITVINDSIIWMDAGGPFELVPRALWNRTYPNDDQFRVEMHQNCLLIQGGEKTVLVDTGLGTKIPDKMRSLMSMENPDGGLVGGLSKHGVKPEDIDIVFNTHLHNDHCGGNTYIDDAGDVQPTFPNAEYITQRLEYADAYLPNERTRGTYFRDNMTPLVDSGQMTLIDGTVEFISGLTGVITPGHTRAHMSLIIESDGEYGLYVADLASFTVHMENLAWMTAYDAEPLITLESKRIWQQWAIEHDATLLFEHDPFVQAGRLTINEKGRYKVEPLD